MQKALRVLRPGYTLTVLFDANNPSTQTQTQPNSSPNQNQTKPKPKPKPNPTQRNLESNPNSSTKCINKSMIASCRRPCVSLSPDALSFLLKRVSSFFQLLLVFLLISALFSISSSIFNFQFVYQFRQQQQQHHPSIWNSV